MADKYLVKKVLTFGDPKVINKIDKKTGGKVATSRPDIVGYVLGVEGRKEEAIMTKEQAVKFAAEKGLTNAKIGGRTSKADGSVSFFLQSIEGGVSLKDPSITVRIDKDGAILPQYKGLIPETTRKERSSSAKPKADYEKVRAAALAKLGTVQLPKFN